MILVRICIYIYAVATVLTSPTVALTTPGSFLTSHCYNVVDIILRYTQYIKDFGQQKGPAAVSECQHFSEDNVGTSTVTVG